MSVVGSKSDSVDGRRAPNLTVAELAAVLQMSEGWVRKGVLERTLPFSRYGRSIRFTPAQVEEIRRTAEQSPLPARRGTARTKL